MLEESRDATRSMFSNRHPDAVFVANDHMALAVMDTLRYELGLKIPDDVSIIGYDDVPAASWPSYMLTTVQQPVNIMVRETVEILIEKIDNITTIMIPYTPIAALTGSSIGLLSCPLFITSPY